MVAVAADDDEIACAAGGNSGGIWITATTPAARTDPSNATSTLRIMRVAFRPVAGPGSHEARVGPTEVWSSVGTADATLEVPSRLRIGSSRRRCGTGEGLLVSDTHDSLRPTVNPPPERAHRGRIPLILVAVGVAVLVLGGILLWRAGAAVNKVALGSSPRPVTILVAERTAYHETRSYVGTLEPWVEANVSPQYVSAYVTTVLVRPGANVHRGDVLATLDCENPTATTQSIASQARAIEERQRALASEAARTSTLLDGGFVSPNEVEVKLAASAAEQAQLLATRSRLLASNLDVRDCVLRAPFDGEIATRTADPGAFVHPGEAVVSVVDRRTIRFTAAAPEKDFDVIAPGTAISIRVLATGKTVAAVIARRAPKADRATRTVHFEADIPDTERAVPVGTTGIVDIAYGNPIPASVVPLYAVSIREHKARVFVVEGDVAHAREVTVLGEVAGKIFLDPVLAGAHVVAEGRGQINDGDRVAPKLDTPPPATAAPSEPRGGGLGRP